MYSMSKTVNKMSFQDFLDYFPRVELPVTFSEDTLADFSRTNRPFNQEAIHEFLARWEQDLDEFTEFIPCVQLPDAENYIGIVYWKGTLMKYDFILATFEKNGILIERKAISSTLLDSEGVKKSMAHLTEDLIIHIIAGAIEGNETNYQASSSQAFSMEILPSGEILFDKGNT